MQVQKGLENLRFQLLIVSINPALILFPGQPQNVLTQSCLLSSAPPSLHLCHLSLVFLLNPTLISPRSSSTSGNSDLVRWPQKSGRLFGWEEWQRGILNPVGLSLAGCPEEPINWQGGIQSQNWSLIKTTGKSLRFLFTSSGSPDLSHCLGFVHTHHTHKKGQQDPTGLLQGWILVVIYNQGGWKKQTGHSPVLRKAAVV